MRERLIDHFVHSLLMDLNHSGESRRALVLESEGLVAERVRRMLAEEGMASCVVDSPSLFEELRRTLPFQVFVVGVRGPAELDEIELSELAPLILLAPLHSDEAPHYRMALPDALLADRSLRDPDVLRRAFRGEGSSPASPPRGELVRRAFEPFDLSQRQLEVLSRALLGESSTEIARHLYISSLTVSNHLHAIYERVGVSGRRELLGRFVRGLVEEGHA